MDHQFHFIATKPRPVQQPSTKEEIESTKTVTMGNPLDQQVSLGKAIEGSPEPPQRDGTKPVRIVNRELLFSCGGWCPHVHTIASRR